MDYYRNKLALITGGSSGIGLSLARQLAQAQANVWILARRRGQLDIALNEIEGCRQMPNQKFGSIQADVTNEQQISTELSSFIDSIGVPDILIHCAGYAMPGMFTELDSEVFRNEMDVNYLGMIYTSKKIVPGMVARRSGHIINVSSIAGFVGTIGYTAYCAAKFAVRGFSEALRLELKNYGIRMSVVFPPNTRTPGYEIENLHKSALIKEVEGNADEVEPDEVARIILKEAAKGKYTILPGSSTAAMHFAYGLGMSFNFINPVMDFVVADAQKKLNKRAAQMKRE